MYVKKSVPRPDGNPGVGIKPRDLLTLLDVDDIEFMPGPDDKGVVIADNIVMKPGRYGITLYMTPGTVEAASPAEGDTDKVGFTPSLKFSHPGNSVEVRELKVNSVNKCFIGILRYCSGKPADLIGSICNPCKLTASYTGNNDANANEFNLTQISKGDDMYIYKGTVPLEEPIATVASGSKVVNFSNEGVYQLSPGEAVIDTISGGADGAVITLYGCAGTAPSVAPSQGKIILKNAKTFNAAEGSQITLRAYNTGGDTGLVWVEQSRYSVV